MVGQIKLVEFKSLETMPQAYQTAWDSVEWYKLTGANYKPVLVAGEQVVHGMNYYFLAEQTIMNGTCDRHLVLIAINECDGQYLLNTKEFKVIL